LPRRGGGIGSRKKKKRRREEVTKDRIKQKGCLTNRAKLGVRTTGLVARGEKKNLDVTKRRNGGTNEKRTMRTNGGRKKERAIGHKGRKAERRNFSVAREEVRETD